MSSSYFLSSVIPIVVLLSVQTLVLSLENGFNNDIIYDIIPPVTTILFYLLIRLFVSNIRPIAISVDESSLLISIICLPYLIHSYNADIQHQIFNFYIFMLFFLVFIVKQCRLHLIINIILFGIFGFVIAYGNMMRQSTMKLYGVVAWIGYTMLLTKTPQEHTINLITLLFSMLTLFLIIMKGFEPSIYTYLSQTVYEMFQLNRQILLKLSILTLSPALSSIELLVQWILTKEGLQHASSQLTHSISTIVITWLKYGNDWYAYYFPSTNELDRVLFSWQSLTVENVNDDIVGNNGDEIDTQLDSPASLSFPDQIELFCVLCIFIVFLIVILSTTVLFLQYVFSSFHNTKHHSSSEKKEKEKKLSSNNNQSWILFVFYVIFIVYSLNSFTNQEETAAAICITNNSLDETCSPNNTASYMDPITLVFLGSLLGVVFSDMKNRIFLPKLEKMEIFGGCAVVVNFVSNKYQNQHHHHHHQHGNTDYHEYELKDKKLTLPQLYTTDHIYNLVRNSVYLWLVLQILIKFLSVVV